MRWRMKCIGPGPGPKNVLAVHDDGRQVCVPYAIWKHKLSKETTVSDAVKKPYAFVIGQVQAFTDTTTGLKKPPMKVGTLQDGTQVYNFTVKTALGNLIDIALWSEFAAVAPSIQESFVMFVDGPVSQREHNGKVYTKIDAKRLAVIPAVTPAERAVVNQVAAPVAVAPVAAAPVAAAPVAAPVAEVAAPVAATEAAPFTF